MYLEHENLVEELNNLENFNPQERLDHARRRRREQLANYVVRIKTQDDGTSLDTCSHNKNIHFQPNITLIEAAARNDAEEVNELLDKYSDTIHPNLQNDDGLSALHQAVIEDCAEVVEVLVEHGADLNIKDADLWTPLHAAVACGNYDLAKYLIDNGASLIEINTDGNMPIDLVEINTEEGDEENDDNEDIEILLDQSMVNEGYTPEMLDDIRSVVPKQMLEDLQACVKEGGDLDAAGEHGETACHIACANGYVEVLEFLLDNGALVHIGDKDDWQPIHAAACWGHDKIVEVLVKHGADLEARTKDGETPYDLTEDEEMQEMLIELKNSGNNSRLSNVRRSQSTSSRTLSVRRSSSMEKRQTSLNDAKQEAMDRTQHYHVDIPLDDDGAEYLHVNGNGVVNGVSNGVNGHHVDGASNGFIDDSNYSDNSGRVFNSSADTTLDNSSSNLMGDQREQLNNVESPTLSDQKETPIETHNTSPQQNECIININPGGDTDSENTMDPLGSPHVTYAKVNGNAVDHADVEVGVVVDPLPVVQSHNTAAKKEKFNDSNEITHKKKCCVIL